MGGGQLYREALPLADECIVTCIELDVPDADTYAPDLTSAPGMKLQDPGVLLSSASGVEYRFQRWVRTESRKTS
ncbi:dihydrofolate reductase [Leucobacter insecticola]|uniref:dihydrofolate reductase n=1 Tax=Leucobacter insecticola TaxID=2714934 RepID=UPI003CC78C36